MKSIYDKGLSFSLFGESHGRGVGITVHGLRAGIRLNMDNIDKELRRRHTKHDLGSARTEADQVQFLSGLKDGFTTGAPLTLFIENGDVRSEDYEPFFDRPRPSHSDYVNRLTNGSYADIRGGGHFSGRLTAPLAALAGFLREELDRAGLRTLAHISQIADIRDEIELFRLKKGELEDLEKARGHELAELRLPMFSKAARIRAEAYLREQKERGDSVGCSCEVAVAGLPAGLGQPFFEGLESRLGALLFSLPGVKAVEFGLGAAYAAKKGSEVNDCFCLGAAEGAGSVETATNYGGGINGGISNGMPLIVRAVFRPTPSIGLPQSTLSLSTGREGELVIKGRHDACIGLKGLRAMDAILRLGLAEYLL